MSGDSGEKKAAIAVLSRRHYFHFTFLPALNFVFRLHLSRLSRFSFSPSARLLSLGAFIPFGCRSHFWRRLSFSATSLLICLLYPPCVSQSFRNPGSSHLSSILSAFFCLFVFLGFFSFFCAVHLFEKCLLLITYTTTHSGVAERSLRGDLRRCHRPSRRSRLSRAPVGRSRLFSSLSRRP